MNSYWYSINKEHRLTKNKDYRSDPAINEKVKNLIKKWHSHNIEYSKKYQQKNAVKIALNKRQRYHSDINFRLTNNLRTRLKMALKNNQKVGSAITDLGCSIAKFKIYLQLKFHRDSRGKHEYMSWDNYGEWHIDHIKPLIKFNLKDPEQLKEACHYTNLQPLWAKDNLKKGDQHGQ